ncbi:MAG: TonB-dependent receptor [Steroidobacteraceae bacterium]
MAYSTDVYYMNWTNIQVSLQNTLGNYTGNAGNAALYGFEGQIDSRLLTWLQAGASLALSHDRITQGVENLSTAIGVINVELGDRLPDSPQSQASLYAETDFEAFSHPAYVRLAGNYTGIEYTGFAATGTKFGDFTTANLRTGITLDRIELIAFLDNAFNTAGLRGALDPAQAGPVFINHQDVFYIRPRTVGLTARVEF